MSAVEFLLSFNEFLFLVGEVNELIESLLVDVTVFLQLLVRLIQFLEQLKTDEMLNIKIKLALSID